jgi:hypothetical protein
MQLINLPVSTDMPVEGALMFSFSASLGFDALSDLSFMLLLGI